MSSLPIIRSQNVNVWYNGLQALHDISLSIEQRQITALIGASGSGKSTFLRALNRMLDTVPLARTSGSILFQQQDVLREETNVIALRRDIGMVFQNPTPFPQSIYDNVAYGLEIQGMRHPHRRFWGRRAMRAQDIEQSSDPIDAAVTRSLKDAALWEEVKGRLHESAMRLSGGQQQRLCIARAIAVRPHVLLLDEPCSQLDPISTHKIEQLLLQLKKDFTIVIVTHNMHQARRIADHVGFFHLGSLIELGTAEQIFQRPVQKLTADYVGGHFG